ncbi:MAG: hypothetical protein GDA36_05000 [Rhodobacteraceae bacterium]|nr:hypothetical protein [Paracoccaceae bacterium]
MTVVSRISGVRSWFAKRQLAGGPSTPVQIGDGLQRMAVVINRMDYLFLDIRSPVCIGSNDGTALVRAAHSVNKGVLKSLISTRTNPAEA